jgi:alpha-L-arabinofuranosidase
VFDTGKKALLTVVNPHLKNAQETEISVRGARIESVSATVLTSTDPRAHNTLDRPHALEPKKEAARPGAAPLIYTFAPASVTSLEISLA